MAIRSRPPRPPVAPSKPAPKKPRRAQTRNDIRPSRFVDEYMIDFNGTQAAIRAGYSPPSAHVTASRLLRRDKIADEIERRRQEVHVELVDRYKADADSIMRGLAMLGFSNMADYVRVNADGQPVIDLSDATRDQFAAITSLKTKRITRTIGDIDIEEVTTELRLASKREALADLARIRGLFKEEGGVQQMVQFNIIWGPGPKPEPYPDEIIEGEAA